MSSINYEQGHQQAQIAYLQGNYKEALTLVDQLVRNFPNNPSCRLLIANIYSIFQQYDLAREQDKEVIKLTKDTALLDCAKEGLEFAEQYKSFWQHSTDKFLEPYEQLQASVQIAKQNSLTSSENEKKATISKNQTRLNNEQEDKLDLQHISALFTETNTLKELIHSPPHYREQESLKKLSPLESGNINNWNCNPFEYFQKVGCEFDQSLSSCFEPLKNASTTSEKTEQLDTKVVVSFFALEEAKYL